MRSASAVSPSPILKAASLIGADGVGAGHQVIEDHGKRRGAGTHLDVAIRIVAVGKPFRPRIKGDDVAAAAVQPVDGDDNPRRLGTAGHQQEQKHGRREKAAHGLLCERAASGTRRPCLRSKTLSAAKVVNFAAEQGQRSARGQWRSTILGMK
jgi:hypothetical protein